MTEPQFSHSLKRMKRPRLPVGKILVTDRLSTMGQPLFRQDSLFSRIPWGNGCSSCR